MATAFHNATCTMHFFSLEQYMDKHLTSNSQNSNAGHGISWGELIIGTLPYRCLWASLKHLAGHRLE